MSTEGKFFAAGLAALVLAGCNFAPQYTPPATAVGSGFKEAVPADATPDAGWKVAQPGDTVERGRWWEIYKDSDLNGLEEKVETANQSVLAAEASFRQARSLVLSARSALLPTVSVSPSVTRSRSSSVSGSTTTTGGTTTTTTAGTDASGTSSGTTTTSSTRSTTSPVTRTIYTAPVDASYEIDLWGRVRNTIAQNAYSAQASAADYANVLLSTQAELAQDYFQVRALDEERRILRGTLQDFQASLNLVVTLFHAGMASDADLAQANAQFASAEAQETDLGVARAQYEHAVAVLVGIPPSRFALRPKDFVSALPPIPLAFPSELLERRPDVASAERQVASANAGIGVARAAYFPSLTLSASAGFESTSLAHWFEWPNRFWSIGPELAETVFDNGVRRAASQRARALYDQTVANYRQTVLGALQSVEDSLSTLRILRIEGGQQHTAVGASLQAVKLSVARYQNGLDSYVNVITAQNAFLTSREAELQVQLRALVASVGLVKDLGGGWDLRQLPSFAFASKPTRPKSNAGSTSEMLAEPNPPAAPPSNRKPEDILQEDESNARVKD